MKVGPRIKRNIKGKKKNQTNGDQPRRKMIYIGFRVLSCDRAVSHSVQNQCENVVTLFIFFNVIKMLQFIAILSNARRARGPYPQTWPIKYCRYFRPFFFGSSLRCLQQRIGHLNPMCQSIKLQDFWPLQVS